jgi:vacuolar-type H+-ATPase subunit D/Vma8
MELDETACALIKQLLQDDKAVVADTTEDKEFDGGEDSGDISYRSFLVEVRNAQVNFIGEETVQEGCVVLSIPSGRMIKYLGYPFKNESDEVYVPSHFKLNVVNLQTYVATGPLNEPRSLFKGLLETERNIERVIKECSAEFRISSVVEIHEDQHVADIVKSVSKIPVDSGSVISKNPGAMSMSLECPLVDITTDSRQYSIITDVIRSLLARNETEVEKIRQDFEYKLQLANVADYKSMILRMQNTLRKVKLRINELEYFYYLSADEKAPRAKFDQSEIAELQLELKKQKEYVKFARVQLRCLVAHYKKRTFKDKRLRHLSLHKRSVVIVQHIEIGIDSLIWFLKGQIPQEVLEVSMGHLFYQQIAYTDDSTAFTFTGQYLNVTNKIPNDFYLNVIESFHNTDTRRKIPVFDRNLVFRVYQRAKQPVAGIDVREHFEVNLAPLSIQVTNKLYKFLFDFFFPGRFEEIPPVRPLLSEGVHSDKDVNAPPWALFASELELEPSLTSLRSKKSTKAKHLNFRRAQTDKLISWETRDEGLELADLREISSTRSVDDVSITLLTNNKAHITSFEASPSISTRKLLTSGSDYFLRRGGVNLYRHSKLS